MSEQPFYEVRNMQKKYRLSGSKRPVNAVNGVGFAVYKGETFGLVGESGCGKTTMVKLMTGLEEADGGQLILDGKILDLRIRKDRMFLYDKVQMVFQDPFSSLNPRQRIYDLFREIYDLRRKGRKLPPFPEWVNVVLTDVGLSDSFLDRYPFQLSGGQRQRIAIARALSVEPEMLILDEAVSALDVSVQAQIIALLQDLQKKRNMTYLFISHNLAVVNLLADRVGIMLKGKLVENGPADEILNDPSHPYTRSLLEVAEKIIVTSGGEIKNNFTFNGKNCPFVAYCTEADAKCEEEFPDEVEIADGRTVCCHHPLNG